MLKVSAPYGLRDLGSRVQVWEGGREGERERESILGIATPKLLHPHFNLMSCDLKAKEEEEETEVWLTA